MLSLILRGFRRLRRYYIAFSKRNQNHWVKCLNIQLNIIATSNEQISVSCSIIPSVSEDNKNMTGDRKLLLIHGNTLRAPSAASPTYTLSHSACHHSILISIDTPNPPGQSFLAS